jgi:hypothetical protein
VNASTQFMIAALRKIWANLDAFLALSVADAPHDN